MRSHPLTPERIAELLKPPGSFVLWGEDPDMFRTWTLGPVIRHRESMILDLSNAFVVERELKRHPEWADEWRITHCSHWAVGWVDHLTYRVLDAKGQPSAIAQWLEDWFMGLRDYPVADDTDYSERTYDATMESIEENGARIVGDGAPEDWAGQVHQWLGDNGRDSYSSDDGYVPEDDIREACADLGIPLQEA